MPFASLSDLVLHRANKRGLAAQVEAAMTLEHCKRILADFFDGTALKGIHPLYIRDSALVIAVLSPALAQELKLREADIVEQLNKKIGRQSVLQIRFLS